jgi:hypothetical protein
MCLDNLDYTAERALIHGQAIDFVSNNRASASTAQREKKYLSE